MKPIFKISIAISLIILVSSTYSQTAITIAGTGIYVQKGVSVSEVGNLDIRDVSANKGSLNNAGIINLKGSISNISSTSRLGSGEIILLGSAKQTIKGSNNFGALTLKKTSGDITIAGNTSVTGQLRFINGIVNTSIDNMLTLNSSAYVYAATSDNSGANESSFVNGPMRKTGNSDFIFPIGKINSKYPLNTIGIELTDTTSATFLAEYFNTTPAIIPSGATKPSEVTAISNTDYWTLKRESGKNSGYVSLRWKDTDHYNMKDMTVLLYDDQAEIKWENAGNSASNLSPQDYAFLRSNIVSKFNLFTYGITAPQQAKQIDDGLLSFEGNAVDNKVLLNWITTSEINNDYFTILRSSDGNNFEALGNVKGAGNSNNTQKYNFIDENPFPGSKNFYKLMKTDFNGNNRFLKIIGITLKKGTYNFNIYPNPSNGQDINIRINNK